MRNRLNPTLPIPAALLGAAAIVAGSWLNLQAQDDPFGGDAAPAAAKQDVFDQPEAAPGDGGKKGKGEEAPRRGPEPVVIQQLRDSNPTTPSQLVTTAVAALNYGRPDEAKFYLQKLIGSKPSTEALADLVDEFADDTLFRFSREASLQPEGKRVSEAIYASSEKLNRDAQRLAGIVANLTSPDALVRNKALGQLDDAGVNAVAPLLAALADPQRAGDHRALRTALVSLGPKVVPPLLGALQMPDSPLRAQVMLMLGRLRSSRATLYLFRPAISGSSEPEVQETAAASLRAIWGGEPTRAEAERTLLKEIDDALAGRATYDRELNGTVELWFWDAAAKAPVARRMAPNDASAMAADSLAGELLAISPEKSAFIRLRLLAALGWERTLIGRTLPLPRGESTVFALAERAGPQVISEVLGDALRTGHVPAARAAVEVLAAIGTPDLVKNWENSPLAESLVHPDQQLRVEAALAIAKLNPPFNFAGAGRVTDVLSEAASTRGVRRLLVGHPRLGEAQSVCGYLAPLGFEGRALLTGDQLFKAATTDPDVEMIIVSDALDRPTVMETVQLLRQDYRTAGLPILVMAFTENMERLQFLLKEDSRTSVVPRIVGPEAAAFAASRVEQRVARPIDYTIDRNTATADSIIDPNEVRAVLPLAALSEPYQMRDERMRRGEAALIALTKFAQSPDTFDRYEIRRTEAAGIEGVNVPALTPAAAALLAEIGSANAQLALATVAGQHSRSLVERQAAVAAFAAAVERRGVMLTTAQIREEYEHYNASESLGPEAQQIMTSLLDAIESKQTTQGALAAP